MLLDSGAGNRPSRKSSRDRICSSPMPTKYSKLVTAQEISNNKIENCIHEYTVIYADGKKAGYYHFYKNEDAVFEIDDLYIFPGFQGKGIGSTVIRRCCSSVNEPIMLYVFIKNQRAISLYRKLGFEVVETVRDSRFIMKRDGRKSE